jgi:hypothetical protein
MNSENPSQKQKESDGTDRPAEEHSSKAQPPISPSSASGISKAQPPPSPHNYTITCDKKRDVWDWIKFAAEIVGIGVVLVYTSIAALQWCEMKRANKLTSAALDLSKTMFAASQAAGLECRTEFIANVDRPWVRPRITVVCPNKGKSNASNVIGEIRFTRIGPNGKIAQDESKSINQSVVLEGDELNPELFVITKKFDFEEYSRERIKVEGFLSYDNSMSRISQKFCQELIVTPVTRSYGWTRCENADAVRKNPSY